MSLRFKVISFLTLAALAPAQARDWVDSPDPTLTPGSYCNGRQQEGYGNGFIVCRRDVGTDTKRMVKQLYDQRFGTRLSEMKGGDEVKIDHLIPLCLGGGNDMDNLWPQHSSTFHLTDEVEHTTCGMVRAHQLKRDEAVEAVRFAKYNPSRAVEVLRRLQSQSH